MARGHKSAATAGILRRLFSMCYELFLLIATLAMALVFPHALLGAFAYRGATTPVLWAHAFFVLLIYCLGFWIYGGQTLAMKIWRIRLVTCDGLPVRPAQALLRYLLCWPSILLCGIGLLWALVDRDKQFLHDRLAGTSLASAA